jgi:hypothetical protein
MALRVVIMFACMVILPVLAIFGTSWLDFGNSPTTQARQPFRASALTTADPTNSFTGSRSPAASMSNPSNVLMGPSAGTARDSNGPSSAPPLSATVPEPQTRDAAAITPNATSGPARKGTRGIPQRPRSPNDQSQSVPTIVDPAAVPASYIAGTPDEQSNRAAVSQAYVPGANNDWFSDAQLRLRELGATYYLLESWGRRGELYRFHCKVAIAGNPDYTRHFECTDAEPARAMQTVLREVEIWRSAR